MIAVVSIADAMRWVTTRRIDASNEDSTRVWCASARGVVVGCYVVTTAHNCDRGASGEPIETMRSSSGEILIVRELALGGDPPVTVCRTRPPDYAEFDHEDVVARGARALATPDEVFVHAFHAEPYSDLAILGVHPKDFRGITWAVVPESARLRVRATPLADGEAVRVVLGDRGSVRAVASSRPGPHTVLEYDDGLRPERADCGSPILDETCAELVGVLSNGPRAEGRAGLVAELCKTAPAWWLERVASQ